MTSDSNSKSMESSFLNAGTQVAQRAQRISERLGFRRFSLIGSFRGCARRDGGPRMGSKEHVRIGIDRSISRKEYRAGLLPEDWLRIGPLWPAILGILKL
jgi:hypothetical protein